MNLNTNNWQDFKINELFDVCLSAGDLKIDTCEIGDIPLVSSGQSNNGIVGYIDKAGDGKAQLFDGNLITVDMFCHAFYQYRTFYAVSHGRVNILIPKFKLNPPIGLFIATIINKEIYKYSYGRALYSDEISRMIIKLTTKSEEHIPDWTFMEEFIKSLNSKNVTTKNRGGRELHILGTTEWDNYRLDELFLIKKGKRLTSAEQMEGNTPYIGAIDSNNGVANYIGQSPIHCGNTISLSYNGSVGECFYQSKPFWATDDVNVLYPKFKRFNKYIALFICTIIKREKYRYSYGRKWILENMNSTVIKLPKGKNGQPNWDFMEDYIKCLPYGDRL